jgi:hypothetical protein
MKSHHKFFVIPILIAAISCSILMSCDGNRTNSYRRSYDKELDKTVTTDSLNQSTQRTKGMFELTSEEIELYNLIMEYRRSNKLPVIPLSKSLTIVAKTHIDDLIKNNPISRRCNGHSWSDKGPWSPCCYTDDHANADCMWSKPRELTNYEGNGYEIFAQSSIKLSARQALELWKSSKGHNAVILNEGVWEDEWKAIGLGLKGGFGVVWFGNHLDVEQ